MILEIEFSAFGYPGRYVKAMHVDGPRGVYKLRFKARDQNHLMTHHEWKQTPEGTICIAEAVLDERSVLSHVTVGVAVDLGEGLKSYRGEKAIRDAETLAKKMAHELAVRPPISEGGNTDTTS